ncbi:hypothetical protein [Prosthecobacter sp.]|jgi:hypothetical protein|uniref:hypothetical protein n=1 Tax=Prosthecobacter sp. TaxID=1965333 RepID=UPI0037C80C24
MNAHLTLAPALAVMSPEGLLGLKIIGIIGIIGLIILIPLGVLLYRNQDRLFGRSTDTPSETSGSLTYGLAQTWLVYVGLIHLTLWLTFGL